MRAILLALGLMLPSPAQEPVRAETDAQCVRCHEHQGALARDSIHASAGVGCVRCHGTDEVVNDRHRYLPGFRPSRIRDVARDCAACHTAVLSAFEPTPHAASAARGEDDPRLRSTCSACHGYHDVARADRKAILARCAPCHERDSHEVAEAVEAFARFDGLDAALDRLGRRAGELEGRPGISVREARENLDEIDLDRVELRVAQHGLDWPALLNRTAAGTQRADGALEALERRVRESRTERMAGLAIFLGPVLLSGILVYVKAFRRCSTGTP